MKKPTPAELSTNDAETIARHYPEYAATITVYTATWNLPGCLPEMDPFRTLDEAAAREFLADALDEVANQSHDDREGATKAAQDIRDGFSLVVIEDYVYSIDSGPPIDDEENRRAHLAIHLKCTLDEVEVETYGENTFAAGGGEFIILTDDEANQAWDDSLESYLDDCVLGELPELSQRYFDREAWKRDARHDGRGHCLAFYDGEEIELGDPVAFYAYRAN